MNWIELKEKILFSYLGADWISIDVLDARYSEIKEMILTKSKIEFKQNENGALFLEIEDVEFYFYNNDNNHFDFDPKEIDSEKKWKGILDFFFSLSNHLEKPIVFRPEDSNKGEKENYLIIINSNGEIEYFDKVVKNYTHPEIENK